MAHRRLPPIEEFVLRCLALSLSSAQELSQLLGLEEQVIRAALVSLVRTESIALAAPRGKQAWAITQKGRSVLETAELITPEERTVPIHFDLITRKPDSLQVP
jgi:DNA-binding transcriptional regulator PaaX